MPATTSAQSTGIIITGRLSRTIHHIRQGHLTRHIRITRRIHRSHRIPLDPHIHHIREMDSLIERRSLTPALFLYGRSLASSYDKWETNSRLMPANSARTCIGENDVATGYQIFKRRQSLRLTGICSHLTCNWYLLIAYVERRRPIDTRALR
jgi:hypothetical protein